jgi:hypothetical protein
VLFDRSWYNRAGVEHVMGFCTDDEYQEFLRACPEFERMLVRSGITLLKYWFSVSDQEQERRFKERAGNPARRWKLSPMDLESMPKWVEYSKAKDKMFRHTDIKQARWWTVEADDKRRARLNCISHILDTIDYEDVLPGPIELPPRPERADYRRPPRGAHTRWSGSTNPRCSFSRCFEYRARPKMRSTGPTFSWSANSQEAAVLSALRQPSP